MKNKENVIKDLQKRLQVETDNNGIQLTTQIEYFLLQKNVIQLNLIERDFGKGGIREVCLSNMQDDGAAFESWAILLKRWLEDIEYIELKWTEPKIHFLTPKYKLAYQRFLYRVEKMKTQFSWFRVNTYNQNSSHQLVTSGSDKFYQNNPKSSREKVDKNPKNKLREFNGKTGERELESKIVNNTILNSRLKEITNTYHLSNQLPVGLYLDNVKTAKAIFTAGNAAIDIWGLAEKAAVIFELKVLKNKRVGILTETLFYANFINDIIKGKFLLSEKNDKHILDMPTKKCVKAYLLCPDLHPLIDKNVFDLINNNLIASNSNIQMGYINIDPNLYMETRVEI